ncbi:MAG: hypothetical protein WAQ53_14905 [Thiofilum sp.]|uniref:hypothetical protein n=1 Tax=Thiofilum sp. TaxID=2212733 RepID=UPI0025EF9559|nr:hypothetical protein [Thiofilum sp.]MBK8451865.1 hypothetical protein [Thiofilum sp.]
MKAFLEVWRRILNALAINNASDHLSQARKLTLLSQTTASTKTTNPKSSLA